MAWLHLIDSCAAHSVLPGCRWYSGLFTVSCINGKPPPSGVSHCNPTPVSIHHLVPRTPLTEPSNHLVYTTSTDPTFQHWILEPHPSSTRRVVIRYLEPSLLTKNIVKGWCTRLIPSMFTSSISLLFKYARKLASPNTCASSWSRGILLWVL